MSNVQCAMCNMCRLLNDVDFPLLIGHFGRRVQGFHARKIWSTTTILGALPGILPFPSNAPAAESTLQLHLRTRVKTAGKDGFTVVERKVAWESKKTGLIICDRR